MKLPIRYIGESIGIAIELPSDIDSYFDLLLEVKSSFADEFLIASFDVENLQIDSSNPKRATARIDALLSSKAYEGQYSTFLSYSVENTLFPSGYEVKKVVVPSFFLSKDKPVEASYTDTDITLKVVNTEGVVITILSQYAESHVVVLDYEHLVNRPAINDVILTKESTLESIGAEPAISYPGTATGDHFYADDKTFKSVAHSNLSGINEDPAVQHLTTAEKSEGALATDVVAYPTVKDTAIGLDTVGNLVNSLGQAITLIAQELEDVKNDTPVYPETPTGDHFYADDKTFKSVAHSSLSGVNDDPNVQHITAAEKSEGALATDVAAYPTVKDTAIGLDVTATEFNLKKGDIPVYPTVPTGIQFLRDDKVFQPLAVGSGGSAAWLYPTTLASTTNAAYKQLSYAPEAAETILSVTANNSTVLIGQYLFDAAIETVIIPTGLWNVSATRSVSNSSSTSYIRVEIFLYHINGTTTTIYTANGDDINDTALAASPAYERVLPQVNCLATDRLGIRLYFVTTRTSNTTLQLVIGDGRAFRFSTSLALRHNQLRDPNGDVNFQHLTQAQKDDLMFRSEYDATDNGYVNGAEAIKRTVYAQETILKGEPVYVSVTGNPTMVKKSKSSDSATMPSIGVAFADIAAGTTGIMIVSGALQGLNTNSYTPNQILYVDSTGGLTPIKPSSNSQSIGVVARVGGSDGVIIINPDYVADYVNITGGFDTSAKIIEESQKTNNTNLSTLSILTNYVDSILNSKFVFSDSSKRVNYQNNCINLYTPLYDSMYPSGSISIQRVNGDNVIKNMGGLYVDKATITCTAGCQTRLSAVDKFNSIGIKSIADGTNITCGVWLKTTTAIGVSAAIDVFFYDVNSFYVSHTVGSYILINPSSWTEVKTSVAKPSNANFVLFEIKFNLALSNENIYIALPFSILTSNDNGVSYCSINEYSNLTSTIAQKKLAVLGDSITKYGDPAANNIYFSWSQTVKNKCALLEKRNYAISGAQLTNNNITYTMYNQITSLLSDSYTPDIIGLAIGTNDCNAQYALGNFSTTISTPIASLNRNEIYGALMYNIYILKTAFPSAKIFFSVPIQRVGQDLYTIKLSQYVAAIRQMCQYMGVVVVESYDGSGITEANASTYLQDGLHPNQDGMNLLGNYIGDSIRILLQ